VQAAVDAVVELKACESPDARGRVMRLFGELRESLFRYLRWLGCTPEEADDAIQEAFLRLHTHLLAERSQENLRAWVFRVAGNLVRDERKSGRRRRNEPLDGDRQPGMWALDRGSSPEQMVLAKESAERLGAAVRRLPADQQKCLALRSQGLRYREIGEILGIGTTTVADALARAVGALAKELS
jgi:RNA polymerase sigma-70 factor (ECF subfamily)